MKSSLIPMRPPGNLRDGLQAFIATLPDHITMAEIGCYAGESTSLFLLKADRIFCVDIWQPYTDPSPERSHGIQIPRLDEQVFDAFHNTHAEHIVKIKLSSGAAALLFAPASLDLVYLDANHYEPHVRADIAAWRTKIKQHGLLAFHDYGHSEFPGVKNAVDSVLGTPHATYIDGTCAFRMAEHGTIQRTGTR